MTFEECMADAQDLKRHMTAHGVKCSIDLLPGRGSVPWLSARKYLRMHHHVASYYSADGPRTPMYHLVRQGRPDVIGPLANGYGGFDLVYRIICMGLANHSGLGGPITIDGVYVPKDSGRGPTWGTEWEGGYQNWSIIPGMLEFMGRADNALAAWTGRPLTSQLEHKTWAPTRKVDRKDFTRATGIALTRKWAAPTPPPPPVVKDDKMYFLVRGDKSGQWWLTDTQTKRHMRDRDEAAFWVFVIRKNGGVCVTEDDNTAEVWPQEYVDNINRADANEVDTTWKWWAAQTNGPAHDVIKQATTPVE